MIEIDPGTPTLPERTLEEMGYWYHWGFCLETDIKSPMPKDPNYKEWDKGYRKALTEDLLDIKPFTKSYPDVKG